MRTSDEPAGEGEVVNLGEKGATATFSTQDPSFPCLETMVTCACLQSNRKWKEQSNFYRKIRTHLLSICRLQMNISYRKI